MTQGKSLNHRIAVVTGASRGLGRGVAEALAGRGAQVVAIARREGPLAALAREVPGVVAAPGDAADEDVAERTFARYDPDIVVLCAGAMPVLGALQDQTWAGFLTNFEVDAKSAFVWLRHALRRPMKRGGHVVVVSSGAALRGSPVSGGYAPAKRAQWFLADYAKTESARLGRELLVHCVLPQLNPSTELGRAGIRAYAERAGITPEAFAKRFDPPLTPAIMGESLAQLVESPERFSQLAYNVGSGGIAEIG
jgi:NAD(P)-dependent dehydrogenase (short-subunit alcohol dehydrogenase family)